MMFDAPFPLRGDLDHYQTQAWTTGPRRCMTMWCREVYQHDDMVACGPFTRRGVLWSVYIAHSNIWPISLSARHGVAQSLHMMCHRAVY